VLKEILSMASDSNKLKIILNQLTNKPDDGSMEIPLTDHVLMPTGRYVLYQGTMYRVRSIGDSTMSVYPCSQREKDLFMHYAWQHIQQTQSSQADQGTGVAPASVPLAQPQPAPAPDDISTQDTMILPAIRLKRRV
jgi:hypothetical protein